MQIYREAKAHNIASKPSAFLIQMTWILSTANSPTLLFSIMFFFGLPPPPLPLPFLPLEDGVKPQKDCQNVCLTPSAPFAAEIDFLPELSFCCSSSRSRIEID